MKYDDVDHFVVRCVGYYSSSEVKWFSPYQHKGCRPRLPLSLYLLTFLEPMHVATLYISSAAQLV